MIQIHQSLLSPHPGASQAQAQARRAQRQPLADRLKIAQEALRLIQQENNLEKSKYNQIDNNFKFDPEARPIWEIAAEISAQIPDSEWAKVPTDLAKNFDKYQTATEDGE